MSFDIPVDLLQPPRSYEYTCMMEDTQQYEAARAREMRERDLEVNSGVYREREREARDRMRRGLTSLYQQSIPLLQSVECKMIGGCSKCPAYIPSSGDGGKGECVLVWLHRKFGEPRDVRD